MKAVTRATIGQSRFMFKKTQQDNYFVACLLKLVTSSSSRVTKLLIVEVNDTCQAEPNLNAKILLERDWHYSVTRDICFMDSKRHKSHRSYSTNVSIQNHWSTALKLLGKTARTQIVTRCTLLMVLYLTVCARVGYTRCSGSISVHLCTALL